MRWTSWLPYAVAAAAVTAAAVNLPPSEIERSVAEWIGGSAAQSPFWLFVGGALSDDFVPSATIAATTFLLYVFLPTKESAVPLAALGGAAVLDRILKGIMFSSAGVAAPDVPPGAVLLVAAWAGSVALVVARTGRMTRWRKAALTGAVLIVLLSGASALIVERNWPMEIVAAWLWAAAVVFLLHRATRNVLTGKRIREGA
ncbi:MAG TPA: hypothetical protein PLE60_13050 [Candidatus Latescibacteria bacterium]|nr:hypothetical protein [Candidatus Latescibacterota bacterium]